MKGRSQKQWHCIGYSRIALFSGSLALVTDGGLGFVC